MKLLDSNRSRAGLILGTAALALWTSLVTGCGEPLPRTAAASQWQSYSVSGLPPGLRAAAYDGARNSLWILNDQLGAQGPHSVVTLRRFDLADHSSSGTSVAMNGDAFVRGSVLVDSQGKVWSGWGRTLAKYDPDSDQVRSWVLPSYANFPHPGLSASEGNMVALGIAGDGEIWTTVHSVQALFGFSTATEQWDKTVQLPFLPNDTSRIASLRNGRLAVNGAELSGSGPVPVLAEVDASTRVVTRLEPRARDYVELSTGRLAYLDDSSNAGAVDESAGKATAMASGVPAAHDPHLVVDASSRAWFSMMAFRSVGVGMVDLGTGRLAGHPFPYIRNPGSPMPNDCPSGLVHCIPSSAVSDPGVQALVLDGHHQLWVITSVAGSLNSSTAPSALYALSAEA